MKVNVTQAKLGDEKRIAQIHVAAWRAAYSKQMGKEFLDALDITEREKMWSSALMTRKQGLISSR
jgi:hypothetical protein